MVKRISRSSLPTLIHLLLPFLLTFLTQAYIFCRPWQHFIHRKGLQCVTKDAGFIIRLLVEQGRDEGQENAEINENSVKDKYKTFYFKFPKW